MAVYLTDRKLYAYLSAGWTEINADTRAEIGVTASWGMSSNRPDDLLASSGNMRFTMSDRFGHYSPNGPDVLAGWGKGTPVKLVCTFDGVDYVRFYGRIDSISLSIGLVQNENTVTVTVLDWMEYASKYPVISPQARADIRANQALDIIVPAMPITPLETSYASGLEVFPAVFDSTTIRTMAYTEFGKLVKSEMGRVYLRKSRETGERLVFEAADTCNGLRTLTPVPLVSADSGFLLLETGDKLLLETGDRIILNQSATVTVSSGWRSIGVVHGDRVINRVSVQAYPKKLDTSPKVLYSLSNPMPIATGQTITFRTQYTDPTGGSRVNAQPSTMIQPVVPGTLDPYLVSLLHFEGGFTDAKGHTWTPNDVTVWNDVYKDGYGTQYISNSVMGSYAVFGGYANWCITSADSPDWDFGAGAFTIGWYETRINPAANQATMTRDSSVPYPPFLLGNSDGNNLRVYMSSNGSSWDIANGVDMGLINRGTWVYREISRDASGWFYAFADGKLISKWYSALPLADSAAAISIGKTYLNSYTYMGFDEFFVLKGSCAHNADYDIPRIPRQTTLTGDYLINTAADGSGTDLTSSATVSAVYGSEAVEYTITNAAAVDGFIILLQARGYGIYQYNPVENNLEDSTSYLANGYANLNIDQQYQRDLIAGNREGAKILEFCKQARTDLRTVSLTANRSNTEMQMWLNLDVGDLIRATHTPSGVDGYYYIHGCQFDIQAGGKVDYTYNLRQAWSLYNGLTGMAADLNNTGTTDALSFGNIPQACNLRYLTASAWIYVTAAPAAAGVIIANYSDNNGWFVHMDAARRVALFQLGATSAGLWYDLTALSLNAWHLVTVTRDTSAASNQPLFYVEGNLYPTIEGVAQVGATRDDSMASVYMGNIKAITHDYDYPLKGQIKDARIYNRILTAAEITALNAAGAYNLDNTDGMVFQAPTVRTSDVAYFTDHTLASGDRLIDNVNGNIGNFHGAPIIRTI